MAESNSGTGKRMKVLIVLLLVLAASTALMLFLKSHDFESEKDKSIEILNFDTDDVSSFTYTLQGKSYNIYRDGNDWKSRDDSKLKLEYKTVNEMLSSCSDLSAKAKVSDDISKASEYGLDEANFSVTIEYKNGSFNTFKVGEENPMTATTYVSIEPEGGIYTMEFTPEAEFKIPSDLQSSDK